MNPQIIAVRELFSKLERNGVRYCVLRNYGFLLDEKIPWESRDISIAKDDFLKADAILGQEGFSRRKPQFSLRHRAYFKLIRDTIVSFDVQVGGVYWNDMSYLGESIFKHRIKKSFFYVPSDNDTFVMLTAHSILGKRYFKPKYQQILSSLQIEGDYVLQELSVIFSQRIAKSLLQSIRHNDFKHIKIYSPLFHFLFKEWQHLKTFSLLSLRWLRWKKFLQPWPLISIIGPDGAGKSTAVNSLNIFLKENHFSTALIYTGRGRNHFLPMTMIGKAYKRAEKKNDFAASAESGCLDIRKKSLGGGSARRILYMLAAPIFTLDLLLRYYFRIFPQRMAKKVVITDRYCSDILLMKNVPLGLKRSLLKLFPKPTITFYLYNSPRILHQRRPQESVEELSRQLKLFEELNGPLKLMRVITEDQNKDRQKILAETVDYLYKNWY